MRLLPCLELSVRLFFGASKAAWRLGNAVFLPSFVSLGWRGRELAEPAAPPSVQGALVQPAPGTEMFGGSSSLSKLEEIGLKKKQSASISMRQSRGFF